jgi:hypothetical protein
MQKSAKAKSIFGICKSGCDPSEAGELRLSHPGEDYWTKLDLHLDSLAVKD